MSELNPAAATSSVRTRKHAPVQEDWISKTLAGCILGIALAFIASSLFALIGPGGLETPNKIQFNMWIVPPIWMTIFSLVYLFRSGLRAWLWLGSFTVVGAIVLVLVRTLGGE